MSGGQSSDVLERPLHSGHRRQQPTHTSVNQHQLTVPRSWRITFGHRAFSVVGPMVWNSLPTEFRDVSVGFGVFMRTLETIIVHGAQ